jgi:phage pi2 protein 07
MVSVLGLKVRNGGWVMYPAMSVSYLGDRLEFYRFTPYRAVE